MRVYGSEWVFNDFWAGQFLIGVIESVRAIVVVLFRF